MAHKISLVYSLALFATFCLFFAPADASSNMAVHARMIKKRLAGFEDTLAAPSVPLIGVGNDPNDANDDSTSISAATATVTETGTDASASRTASPSSSGPGGIGLSLPPLGSLPTASSSATGSSALSSSSATANSTSSATPSSTATPSLSPSTDGTSVVFATVTTAPNNNNAAASPTNTGNPSGAAADGGHLTRNTIIAIVVVAACVGGAVIIWTVIRKWKFAPSDEFGDRLNPIDWRPTSSGDKEKTGEHDPTGHRRNGSRGSNRSFVSADAHNNNNSNYPNNTMIPDLPAHDFTAGAAGGHPGGLAPIGAYADLRRGPSPAPSMGEQYHRGYGATQYGRNGY